MSNRTLSRTRLRRWSILLALLLVTAAVLVIALATVNSSLLDILQHPHDDVFLITGFIVLTFLSGALFFPLYFEPNGDTDSYDPEATPEIPYAGTDIEPLTRHPLFGYHVTADKQEAIRDRLRNATVTTIHRQTGISTADASARVQRGNWTENATAAWFLGETPPPRSVQFYARISDSLAFRHGARETIAEIVAYEQRHTDTEADAP